jgi:hypothetical protein
MRTAVREVRWTFLRNLAVSLVVLAAVAIATVPAHVFGFDHGHRPPVMTLTPTEGPPVAGSAEDLIARHDCWVWTPPAGMVGRIPGHVVAEVGGRAVYSRRLVHAALEHSPAVHVRGWCR